MKEKRVTKKAIFASLLSVAVCTSMLIGTSYAWFTDSVTSSGNIIKSGKLDIELSYMDGSKEVTDEQTQETTKVVIDPNADDAVWKDASDKPIFTYDLWEPGYVDVKHIKIENKGNLALKYKFAIIADGELKENANGHTLADAIDVYYVDPATAISSRADISNDYYVGTLSAVLANMASEDNTAEGVLYPEGNVPEGGKQSEKVTIVLKMRESAGNEFQDMELGTTFSVQLLATQFTYEEDTFDDQYDEGADLNFRPVVDAAGFNNALSAGLAASLDSDLKLGNVYELQPGQDAVINGNGNTLSATNGTRIININDAEGASLTLNDVDLDASDKERAISIYGSPDAEININGSDVAASRYAINLASDAPGTEINVSDSTVTGWCAVQTWSKNATINIDNSTLIGNNDKTYNADGWNNFSTIVINEPAEGSVITIRNSRIEANQTTGNKQTFVSFRAADGATVIFENCTFWKDGVQITDLQEFVNNVNFTSWDAVNNSHLIIDGVDLLAE